MGDDTAYIRRSVELARAAADNGNPPFGSLLVRDGSIVQTAENTTRSDGDITAHPELKLARWAATEYGPDGCGDKTMYTSTEPCPMCAASIYYAGLGRVVYCVAGETLGEIRGSRGLSIPCADIVASGDREIVVTGPVLESEGRKVHDDYYDA